MSEQTAKNDTLNLTEDTNLKTTETVETVNNSPVVEDATADSVEASAEDTKEEKVDLSEDVTKEAETVQDTIEEETYSVDLSTVEYNSTFRVNKGALSQLVVSLKDMSQRLSEPEKENKMQEKLYPAISKICDQLYNKYVSMLSEVNEDHYREFSYFLMGPYKNGTLRHPTAIRAERKMYKYSELGPTFRAMTNRLVHASREVSSRLESEKYADRTSAYEALKTFLSNFDVELKECSLEWKNTVYSIRDEVGIEKKERKPRFKRRFKNFNNRNGNNHNNNNRQGKRFVKFRRRAFNDQGEDKN